jgi:hypothetical protein
MDVFEASSWKQHHLENCTYLDILKELSKYPSDWDKDLYAPAYLRLRCVTYKCGELMYEVSALHEPKCNSELRIQDKGERWRTHSVNSYEGQRLLSAIYKWPKHSQMLVTEGHGIPVLGVDMPEHWSYEVLHEDTIVFKPSGLEVYLNVSDLSFEPQTLIYTVIEVERHYDLLGITRL